MKDLAAEDVTTDVQGWLRWARAQFLQVDLFGSVPASDTLMRIHSTAEEFDSTAEDFLAPFQVSILVDSQSLLSLPFMPGSVPPYTCLFCKRLLTRWAFCFQKGVCHFVSDAKHHPCTMCCSCHCCWHFW